jgi:23S rRNA pseudouridine2605 synthase
MTKRTVVRVAARGYVDGRYIGEEKEVIESIDPSGRGKRRRGKAGAGGNAGAGAGKGAGRGGRGNKGARGAGGAPADNIGNTIDGGKRRRGKKNQQRDGNAAQAPRGNRAAGAAGAEGNTAGGKRKRGRGSGEGAQARAAGSGRGGERGQQRRSSQDGNQLPQSGEARQEKRQRGRTRGGRNREGARGDAPLVSNAGNEAGVGFFASDDVGNSIGNGGNNEGRSRRNRSGKRTPFRSPQATQGGGKQNPNARVALISEVAEARRWGDEAKTGQFAEAIARESKIKRERLHKVLAQSGHGSRRDMEILIQTGRVMVNGIVATTGTSVSPMDVVLVDHRPVKLKFGEELPRVMLYHKPDGEIVTTNDPGNRITVFDNLPRVENGKWMSIGRLDINTSGLLIFTTSGELANRLMHPRYEVEREYAVRTLGELTDEQTTQLLSGVSIANAASEDDEDAEPTQDDRPAKFDSIEARGGEGANQWYHVVIREGRNREVRKMFEAVGLTVSRLIRVRFGKIGLPPRLTRGQMIEFDPGQVRAVLKWVGMEVEGKIGHLPQYNDPRSKQNRSRAQQGEALESRANAGVSGDGVDDAEAPPSRGERSERRGKRGRDRSRDGRRDESRDASAEAPQDNDFEVLDPVTLQPIRVERVAPTNEDGEGVDSALTTSDGDHPPRRQDRGPRQDGDERRGRNRRGRRGRGRNESSTDRNANTTNESAGGEGSADALLGDQNANQGAQANRAPRDRSRRGRDRNRDRGRNRNGDGNGNGNGGANAGGAGNNSNQGTNEDRQPFFGNDDNVGNRAAVDDDIGNRISAPRAPRSQRSADGKSGRRGRTRNGQGRTGGGGNVDGNAAVNIGNGGGNISGNSGGGGGDSEPNGNV